MKDAAGAIEGPLVVSGLASAGLLAAATAGMPVQDGLVGRLLEGGLSLAILWLGLGALVFGLLILTGQGAAPGTLRGWLGARGAEADATSHDLATLRRAAPLGLSIWALPLLGFIGTVVGISGAIGELGAVFEGGDRQTALAEVLGQLRFAFDTTFAGLVGVLPVALVSVMISLRAARARAAFSGLAA